MLIEILWPVEVAVVIDAIGKDGYSLVVTAHGSQKSASCPLCGTQATRIHGYYHRNPADLPCGGYTIKFDLTVPRFFCDNEACDRQTFAAIFPTWVSRYARRTVRLKEQQREVGFAVSAEQGARLLPKLHMETSPDTLIRLVRNAPEPTAQTPRVLGVDDWAKRKGQTYGTILVDLEQHRVVDLLDERSAESLAQWLQAHPGVEIICRDRGTEYAEGAARGAPEAVQIADRFHLLQNLLDALKRLFEECPSVLRDAARQVAAEMQVEKNPETAVTLPAEMVVPSEEKGASQPEKQTVRTLRFAEVKELQSQGWSQRAIAEHLQIHRRTVSKYFAYEAYPERASAAHTTSKALPYLAYLTQRWTEGCNDIAQLHNELQALGFEGHYMSTYRLVKQQLQTGNISPVTSAKPVPIPRLSVTEAAWLVVHPDERLDDMQVRLRTKLRQMSNDISTACELTQSFISMVHNRISTAFDGWLEQAEASQIKAFMNFAVSLKRDYAAVHAALSYTWSSGQVEGQVNRLKLTKRKLYGRANFDLLRKHVLGMPMAA
jgi:transposase/predicted transcriptional regulator